MTHTQQTHATIKQTLAIEGLDTHEIHELEENARLIFNPQEANEELAHLHSIERELHLRF